MISYILYIHALSISNQVLYKTTSLTSSYLPITSSVLTAFYILHPLLLPISLFTFFLPYKFLAKIIGYPKNLFNIGSIMLAIILFTTYVWTLPSLTYFNQSNIIHIAKHLDFLENRYCYNITLNQKVLLNNHSIITLNFIDGQWTLHRDICHQSKTISL